MKTPMLIKRLVSVGAAASLFAIAGWVNPVPASAAIKTTTTGANFNLVYCKKSPLLKAAIEIRYYGRALATQYYQYSDGLYWRAIDDERVDRATYTVNTYNKCGSGRKAKAVKSKFTVVTAWSGKWTMIDMGMSGALSLPGGVSVTAAPAFVPMEKVVTEKVTSTSAKRSRWYAEMHTQPLKWAIYNVTESGLASVYPTVDLYLHAFVRYENDGGSDYRDFGKKKVTLK